MTKKRFSKYVPDVRNGYTVAITIVDNETGKQSGSIDDFVELLNELHEENEELKQAYTQLKHRHSLLHDVCLDAECDRDSYHKDVLSLEKENEQSKHNNKMLSMKMSEVYTKYCLLKEFSEDTNPNDAVKRVLSELMQITKEYR